MCPMYKLTYSERKTGSRRVEANNTGVVEVGIGAVAERVVSGCDGIGRTCGALQIDNIIEEIAAIASRRILVAPDKANAEQQNGESR